MNNPNSSSGIGEDLIRSFVQFGCAEMHYKTLYEKTVAELENGMVDVEDSSVLNEHLAKQDNYLADMNEVAQLRRRTMMALFSLFEGDKDAWCLVKHLGIGAMTLFEAYQASDNDPELLNIAIDANKAFVLAVTRFLGAEISDCAACLSDFLKAGKDVNNSKGEDING